MTEEIKEILFQLEIVARKHTIKVTDTGNIETMPASVVDELRLNNYSAKLLLNYITNLQKENTDLKKLCDKYKEEHNTTFKLWTMKMEEMPDYEEKIKYKSRNEKAIEYIENNLKSFLYSIEHKTLLNILEGGDE